MSTRRPGTGARRLAVAGLSAIAAFILCHVALAVFLDLNACRTPVAWWPHWAWFCDAPGQRAARAIGRQGWQGALPVMAGAAAFLAVGLTAGPSRRGR
jgi:hypothetical protein